MSPRARHGRKPPVSEGVEVHLADRTEPRMVGRLLDTGNGPWFEYDEAFLRDRVDLSPFSLPRRSAAFPPGPAGLHRLRGLFYDALPDGWGLRMLHQAMRDSGTDPLTASSVAWLRALGSRAMGALTFHPETPLGEIAGRGDNGASLDLLAVAARKADRKADLTDAGDIAGVLPALERAGGSSAGARPKVVVAWHDSGAVADAFAPLQRGYRHTLVKFASSREPADAPAVESAWLTMAARAGIEVPAHRLHRLRTGQLALVIDRFDRVRDERRHVHSLAGLLEIDIQRDFVSYEAFIAAAIRLCNDVRTGQAAWLRAAFNVAALNRDDHARNVAFLMAPGGSWRLAPAYDLTLSAGPGGYHSMSVDGESRTPGREHLLRLASAAGLDRAKAVRQLDRVRAALSGWKRAADAAGLRKARVVEIGRRLASQSAFLAPTR